MWSYSWLWSLFIKLGPFLWGEKKSAVICFLINFRNNFAKYYSSLFLISFINGWNNLPYYVIVQKNKQKKTTYESRQANTETHTHTQYSNCVLAVGELPHLSLIPPSLSDIKQGALATDRTHGHPQRPPDWNLATGPNSCFKQKTSAYFRFVFHKLTPQPAKNLGEGVYRLVYN